MKSLFMFIGFMFLLSEGASAEEWLDVRPGDMVNPSKHLLIQKDYRVQWWYFTGHLYDSGGREFGFELTFFSAGVQKKAYRSKFGVSTVYLSHFAVSDVGKNKYYHFSSADAGAYGFAGSDSKRLRVWVGNDSLEGDLRKMHIKAQADDIGLDLVLVPNKPVVLHGKKGYSRKSDESPLFASLYFSFTNLETTGLLKLKDAVFPVTGKSWFDREISSRGLASNEAGWDWFSLQLDDGREIMLYNIRKKDGSLGGFSSGTFVYQDGSYKHLAREDYEVTILDRYTSKHTGAQYPAQWQITIPSENLKLMIRPFIQDQEFTGTDISGKSYWEGTCRVEGSATGRAYVEMTGY